MNMLSIAGTVQEEAIQIVTDVKEVAEQGAETLRELGEEALAQEASAWDWSHMLWTALICICAVFFMLVLLIFVMKLFGVVFTKKDKENQSVSKPQSGQIHEEEIAAIATALKMFKGELHDRESEVLTILNIKRAYSPWNSKIHGLTQMPERKF